MGCLTGYKPCWLRSAARSPTSGTERRWRSRRDSIMWPAWLSGAAGSCCTSSTISRSWSPPKRHTVACGLASKPPTGCWTQAFPKHRAPISRHRGSRSRSTSTRPFSRIFNDCAPRCETKHHHSQFLEIRKESGDGNSDNDTRRTSAATTWRGEQPLHLDLRGALHLVDGRRLSRFLAPSQPQGRGDELLHPVSRPPLLGHDRDRDLSRPQRRSQLPPPRDVGRAPS